VERLAARAREEQHATPTATRKIAASTKEKTVIAIRFSLTVRVWLVDARGRSLRVPRQEHRQRSRTARPAGACSMPLGLKIADDIYNSGLKLSTVGPKI
jgi:hypothetical protein